MNNSPEIPATPSFPDPADYPSLDELLQDCPWLLDLTLDDAVTHRVLHQGSYAQRQGQGLSNGTILMHLLYAIQSDRVRLQKTLLTMMEHRPPPNIAVDWPQTVKDWQGVTEDE